VVRNRAAQWPTAERERGRPDIPKKKKKKKKKNDNNTNQNL
jgi:hypothetical protein